VFWRPNIAHLKRKEYSTQRAQELLNKIDDYDVICLNEAFACIGSPINDFISAARKKGFVYVARPSPCEIFSIYVVDSGVIILSKLPILQSDSIVYNLGCGVDMFSRKGAVYAKIQTSPNSHINVFATHMQANYPGMEIDVRTVRNQQFRELLAFIKRTSIDSFPIFIFGDLNINANSKTTIGRLNKTEYDRIWDNLKLEKYELIDLSYASLNQHPVTFGEDEQFFTTGHDVNSKQSIDYAFLFRYDNGAMVVSKQETSVVKMESDGKEPYTHLSDHYALKCDIEFENSPDFQA